MYVVHIVFTFVFVLVVVTEIVSVLIFFLMDIIDGQIDSGSNTL